MNQKLKIFTLFKYVEDLHNNREYDDKQTGHTIALDGYLQ